MTTPKISHTHGLLEDCDTLYTIRGDSADPLTAPSCTHPRPSHFRIEGTSDNVAAVEWVSYRSSDLTSHAVRTGTYKKWRLRFRTGDSSASLGVTVKVEFTDATFETLYGATPAYSITWLVASGTFAAAKTIKYIYFYAGEDAADNANATAWVDIDFLQIYTDMFTFPYVSGRVELEFPSSYAYLLPPGRVGNITQFTGSPSVSITIEGDMELGSWGTPDGERFMEVWHEAHDAAWVWFESDKIKCKVTPDNLRLIMEGAVDGKPRYRMVLRECRRTSAEAETFEERFGLNL